MNLGRLESVDLRDAWKGEASDFTPWLAQDANIRLLGEVIGMELEVESTEKAVGPFNADILCRETNSNDWVLIENQLARTDHTHLGQIMTYAAGLHAVSIVWIAARFTEEHRAAIDWLNEISVDGFNFFALEIELWRIGESPPAPKFNVVAKPNEWVRSIRDKAKEGDLSDVQLTQRDFWQTFKEYMDESSFLRCTKPLPQNWMNISMGRSGFKLAAVASTWSSESDSPDGEIRAELYIDTGSTTKDFYALLERDKESAEADFGETLCWYNPPEKRACKLYQRRGANIRDRNDWPNQHAWLRDNLERLHKVFAHRVKSLDLDQQQEISE